MNITDFSYYWRGKELRQLDKGEAKLLAPVDIRKKGNESAILLLHGFASTPAVFRLIIPALSTYDAIICPALPGHCLSISEFSNFNATKLLSTTENICESLIKNYKRVDVLGLSLGGLLACHLSERFSLNHLYLLAPALALTINIPLSLKLAKILKMVGFKNLNNRAGNLCSELHNEICYNRLPISSIMAILTMIRDNKFLAPNCPTDLFLGSHDKVVNSVKVAEIFKNIKNCATTWLENSSHVLPLDNDVDKIITTIQENQDHRHTDK